MQRVIRRTALARNQAKRKAIRAEKEAEREEYKEILRHRFQLQRMQLDAVRSERQRRREDWMKGPLAPQRDTGVDAVNFGSFSPQAMQAPTVPKKARQQYVNFAPGDRVCIMKGRDKGKISEIVRVDEETETVTVKDMNKAAVNLPKWLVESQEAGQKSVQAFSLPIPFDDVRLVVALDDPETGTTRDVLVKHVYGGEPYLEREHGTSTPRHTRYIAGLDIEIPWPSTEPPALKEEDCDTLRMEVETPTWIPSLKSAPFPPSVLDELRNKFSKYRTRHDPQWVREKQLEDYRKEYLASRSLLTPRSEYLAFQRAKYQEQLKSKRDAQGNWIMDNDTAAFIERFLQRNAAGKKPVAAA